MRHAIVVRSLPALCLLSTALASPSGEEHRYERRDGSWFRLEDGFEYAVDPEVISLRLEDDAVPLAQALADLPAPLSELELVRSNRLGIHDLRLPEGADPLAVVGALRATGRFAFVEENLIGRFHLMPDDAQFLEQWNFHNTGQFGGTPDADVDATEAWDLEDGDPSIVIAVIDSGADDMHPDLAASIWTNPNEILNGIDDDQNGYVDDIRGWDFVEDDNDPVGNTGHGTAVASMPGAVANNGIDLAGLAGGAMDGAGCRIMNLQMSNAAVFASGVVDDAILYAADNGARVITLSLGIGNTTAMNQAITYAHDVKGVFINCSAGNNGRRVEFPASHPLVLAVGSSDKQDAVSGFSGRGPELEVVAPGDGVPALKLGGGILSQTGTSFSSPTVAGLAGLLLSRDPSLTNEAVRQLIRQTADDIDAPGFDPNAGWGRINAHQALLAVPGYVAWAATGYGAGLAGTGGVIPAIQVANGTSPRVGSSNFALSLGGALGATTAILGASGAPDAIPFKGGQILIRLTAPVRTFVHVTGDGGNASQTLPVPNDPTLIGRTFHAQWIVQDPGAPQGWALTPGLAVTFGS